MSPYFCTCSGALSVQYSRYQYGYGRFKYMSTYTFHFGEGLPHRNICIRFFKCGRADQHLQDFAHSCSNFRTRNQLSLMTVLVGHKHDDSRIRRCTPISRHVQPDVFQLDPCTCSYHGGGVKAVGIGTPKYGSNRMSSGGSTTDRFEDSEQGTATANHMNAWV